MGNNYWENRQKQRQALTGIVKDLENFESSFLSKLAWAVNKNLKLTIQQGKRHGKVYKRGKKTHIASAPGESPVTDTGRLVNSIGSPKKEKDHSYIIPITAQHAMYLELGTIKMRPRPFIERSMKKAWEEVMNDK